MGTKELMLQHDSERTQVKFHTYIACIKPPTHRLDFCAERYIHGIKVVLEDFKCASGRQRRTKCHL